MGTRWSAIANMAALLACIPPKGIALHALRLAISHPTRHEPIEITVSAAGKLGDRWHLGG